MGPPKGGGGGGGKGVGKGGPWDEDRLDASEEGEKLLGTLMFEEEGEAKTTKAFKKLEENKNKKPWEQALQLKPHEPPFINGRASSENIFRRNNFCRLTPKPSEKRSPSAPCHSRLTGDPRSS